jgi:Na+/melibiose symporter-like transporter
MSVQTPIAPERRLSTMVKMLYSVGSLGSSMKLAALSTFLVIYYNQVVKVDPKIVGAVLMITVVADALFDPLIGQISDNFRSRWGRRHPFMLASAIPYAISFFMLWNPPAGWSDMALGGYLLACLLCVRFFDTFFELPHQALAPELAKDYDERTKLFAWRQLFAVVGTLALAQLGYQYFLKENADGSGGVLSASGYFGLSVTIAVILVVTILATTFGTAKQIPYLVQPPKRTATLGQILREAGQTLNNRSFVLTTLVGMLWAIGGGARGAFDIYFGIYFWEFAQSQLAMIATITAIGGVLGLFIAPFLARTVGKKWGLVMVSAGGAIAHMTPISLRLMGLAPENGTTELLVLIYVEEIIRSTLGGANGVLMASLLADIVEDAEVKTGRRSEGLLLSAGNLFRKSVSGVGIFISTLVLVTVQFPIGAERGEVPPEVLHNMGMIYIPLVGTLWSVAIFVFMGLKVSRRTHEDNLRELATRAAEKAAASPSNDSPAP